MPSERPLSTQLLPFVIVKQRTGQNELKLGRLTAQVCQGQQAGEGPHTPDSTKPVKNCDFQNRKTLGTLSLVTNGDEKETG